MIKRKRPSDINQLAHSVVQDFIAISEKKPPKNPAAVALGRLGGLKGGRARAKKLTAKKRIAIARKAAKLRWSKVR